MPDTLYPQHPANGAYAWSSYSGFTLPHLSMQGPSDQLLGELGHQHRDLLLNPLDPHRQPESTSFSPNSFPITPYVGPALPFAPITVSSTSSPLSSGESSKRSSTPWKSSMQFASHDYATLANNPYFGFANPSHPTGLPSTFQAPLSQSLPNVYRSDFNLPPLPDTFGNMGRPFNPDAMSFSSINPSMLQAESSAYNPSSANLYSVDTPPYIDDAFPPGSASPPNLSASSSSPDFPPNLYDNPNTHRAHRWSYSDSLQINTCVGIDPSLASATYSRPFSAGSGSSDSSTAPRKSAKSRKLSESSHSTSARRDVDPARRKTEFEVLSLESGGNLSKRDRRRLQNRLAQRAFRARTKALARENRGRSPSARSRPSE